METNHTPGPWDILIKGDPKGINATRIVGNRRYLLTDEEYVICRVEAGHKESEANARLIASAPDLLAACKMALETIKHACLEEFNIPQDYLERAINKALGRQ